MFLTPARVATAALAALPLLALTRQVSLVPSADPMVVARPALDDATIIAIFDVANTADIETGALGMRRGASKEVRAVGKRLNEDHLMVRKLGRDLAAKLGVTPTPPSPNPYAEGHVAAMAALDPLRGNKFDRAFLEHEIAYHVAVIEAINTTLLPAIKNPELKALVVKVAPHFQAHLDLIKATKVQLKIPAE